MKARNLSYCITLLLVLAGVMRCFASDSPNQEGWHKVDCSGVVIEFQDGLGPLARQLMPKAIELTKNGPQAQSEQAIAKLVPKKNEILRFIASQLDLAKPTKESIQFFDSIVKAAGAAPSPRHIQLWHIQKLREAVKSENGVPCVTYDSANDKFSTYFYRSVLDGVVAKPAPMCIPIDSSLAKPQIDQATEYLNTQKGADLDWDTHAVFHEITEMMIITGTPLHGCFRRWICDGTANYVGALCLGKFVSKPAMEMYFAKQAQYIEKHTQLRDQVDLLGWKAVEYEKELPNQMSDELTSAHYGFATYEVIELAKRHGSNVIAKIFKEICKSRVKGGHDLTDAVTKVTGEDFNARLSAYGAKNSDELRGIGFIDFQFVYNVEDNTVPIEDGTEVAFITDGEHGIAGSVIVDALRYPVEVKWEMSYISSAQWISSGDKYMSKDGDTIMLYTMGELFSSGKLKPGDNTLSLYLQGKLVKQVKFKLVAAN